MKVRSFRRSLALALAAAMLLGPASYADYQTVYAAEQSVQSDTILSVTEAIDLAEGSSLVEGYIVGWGNSGKFVLDSEGAGDDVIIIADSPEEQDTKKMMVIRLSSLGTEKSKWGLGTNPEHLGAKVIVGGKNESYYGGRGIKTVTSIAFSDKKVTNKIKISHDPGKTAKGTIVWLQPSVENAVILYKTDHDLDYKEYNYNTGIVLSQDTVITAKYEDTALSEEEFSFAYEVMELDDITIADVREGNSGSVTFKGIVTRVVEGSTKNSMYVQDQTAGIYVYGAAGDKVQAGDEVVVTGEMESYNNLLEVTNATVTLAPEQTLEKITPQEITIEEFLADPDAYESELLHFKDVKLGKVNYNGSTTVSDATGQTVIYKIVSGIEEGYSRYDVLALGARYNNNGQLSVVNTADVIPMEGFKEMEDLILKQGQALDLAAEVEVYEAGVKTNAAVEWDQHDIEKIEQGELGQYTLHYQVLDKTYTMNVVIVSAEGVKISDIQGKSHISPFVNTEVADVQGVITAIDGKYGFYMQDLHPDGDEATSDAIYVQSYNHGLETGTLVEVSGKVEEKVGYTTNTSSNESVQLLVTQLTANNVKTLETGVSLPKPVIIGKNGRMPKAADIIDNDYFEEFDPEEDFIDFYESLEGMLVEIQDAQVTGGNKYNEIPVVPDRGIHSSNGLSKQGGVVVSENTMHPEILMLAKGMNTKQPTVMTGDIFAGSVVGVMTYNDGNYKVAVSEALPEIEAHTYDADAASTLEETENGLRIASFNVENLGGDAKQSKINDIAKVIVEKMLCPDVIGLQEVQDNSGSTNDGIVSADLVYSRIIDAVKAIAPEMAYEYVEIAPENNQDGGAAGGNIRVGMLYRADRVALAEAEKGDALTATAVVKNEDGSASLSQNPGRIDPQNPIFSATRKSLAVEFIFNGEKVFVINNHLSSKGGDTPLFGNIQPAQLISEIKRTKQAEVINQFTQQLLKVDPKAKIVLLGDMNDFYFSTPVKALAGDTLYNMHYNLPESERYTYSFQGKSQVLDNILVANGLEAYTDIEILHMNSSRAKGVQLSDHDPVMIRINMDKITSETHPDEADSEDNSNSGTGNSTGSSSNSGTGNSTGSSSNSGSGNSTGSSSNSSSGNSSGSSSNSDNRPENDEEGIRPAISFKDVSEGHWAQKDIQYLAARGFIIGVGNNEFAPNRGVKACDFKTLLSRVYEKEIDLGDLKAGQLLTRAQVAVLVKETIAGSVEVDTMAFLSQYKDTKGLAKTEAEALAFMQQSGVMIGVSQDKMAPDMTLTRAQTAVIMTRLLKQAE